jgi:protein arginine kinase activator
MVCNVCKKNEATVHLTQIVENKMQKIDLCDTCAKENGLTDATGFSLADFLFGLFRAGQN